MHTGWNQLPPWVAPIMPQKRSVEKKHTHTHAHIYTHIYVYIYICMYVCIYTHTHIYINRVYAFARVLHWNRQRDAKTRAQCEKS